MFEPCRILDITVHRATLAGVCEQIDGFVASGRPHQIVTVNMDFIRLARTDLEFRTALNEADLAVADGVPVLWLLRLTNRDPLERVTGVDLVQHAAGLAAARGYRIFLLGGRPGVADRAAASLVHRSPNLQIAGTYSPPFGPLSSAEDDRMIRLLHTARPDMLFVAFGAPRQDVWIRRHLEELQIPVCIGVGGTFDILAGQRKRAPLWMQRSGLEWSFRLAQEPRRLAGRYLLGDFPTFLQIAGSQLLSLARS
jgi:N-acetylglucosaminyldiphosphoundecaprenol N-acetyl-beta-D-mannosaminyltransferase